MDQPVILSKLEQEYLLRSIETAVQVRDLRQLFLWTQGQFQALLPHQLMVCVQLGAGGRPQRVEALHGSVIDPAVLARLCAPASGLAVRLARHCSASGGMPCATEIGAGTPAAGAPAAGAPATLPRVLLPFQDELAGCGFNNLLLDGTGAIDGGGTVFLLFGLPMRPGPRHAYFLNLLLAHLHLALARLAAPTAGSATRAASVHLDPAGQGAARALSPRETQVMQWLRAGKRNDEIADILGLSALTVKNHLQRIYKVLGVRNRTEAVSRCSSLRELSEGQ